MADAVHEESHMQQVMNYVCEIMKEFPEADEDVLEIAVWWHDVGRSRKGVDHATDGAEIASIELKKLGFDEGFIKKVAEVIISHSNSSNKLPQSIEAKILKDADKLDFLTVNRWKIIVQAKEWWAIDGALEKIPLIRNQILSLDKSREIFDRLLNELIEYAKSDYELPKKYSQQVIELKITIKAVIFDKDGVLIDSEDTHIKSVVQAFRDSGIELSLDEKKWIVGRSPVDYMPLFAEKYNLTDERLNELDVNKKKLYYELLKSTPVFHKTVVLLKSLHKMKIPIALCTQGSRKNALITLELIGIKDYFNCIITRDDCSKRKPDPEPYLTTAMRLGVDPKNCLVIEDSEIGLKSALNAGMKCIVIYNDHTKGHDFAGALEVVESADKIKIEEIIS